MAEASGEVSVFTTRKAILPEPSGVVYHPNTLRGKINKALNDGKEAYGRYFQGKDPIIKTKAEEEASKK